MKPLVLVAIAILALSHQPAEPPESKGVSESKRAKVGNQEETANQHKTAAVNPPPSCTPASGRENQYPSGALDSPASKPNDDIEIQRKLVTFTGLLVLVGALQFIALVVQSIVFYCTLAAIRGQLTAMKEAGAQTDKLIGRAAEQAKATQDSADAAKTSLEMLISKERARIWIEPAPLDLDKERSVEYKLSFHGTTPAFILDAQAGTDITDSPDPATGWERLSLPMVPIPRQITPQTPLDAMPHLTISMSEEDVEAIRGGTKFFHFRGFIKYRDVFDRERETSFCYCWNVYFGHVGAILVPIRFERWQKTGPPEANRET
jgi:hypothetical protein